MINYRENYFKARDEVAEELKNKFYFTESYRDNDRLTLDSTNNSIHLTFYLPDGNDVFISDKGENPSSSKSFGNFLFKIYPDTDVRLKALKEMFKNSRASGSFDYSIESIKDDFLIMIHFLNEYYPNFFL